MQTSPSDLTSFRAFVDQNLITSASNFFDNSLRSVLRELLQNSRRSGATRVDLQQSGARWVYTDNGPGCMPKDLLGLGSSRWQEDVAERESPAGCGFFSLARRNPTVLCPSQRWRTVLTESHFNGQDMIVPEDYTPGPEDENIGISITFDRGDSSGIYGLDDIAKFMPIDFYLNGVKKTSRMDFMAVPSSSLGGRTIEYNEHITVRVDLVRAHSPSYSACYQGFEVDLAQHDYLSFGCVHAGPLSVRASVMVRRERALPLELPQRNKMVKNETTEALKDLIYCTGLELAAEELKDTCVASPTLWTAARSRGYTGPVLYTKWIGQLVTRIDDVDISDYEIEIDDSHDAYAVDRYVSFDEFENGDHRLIPDEDILALIAQTTIPYRKEGDENVIDLDTAEYFAPGLRLVKPLESLSGFSAVEGSEAHDFYQRRKDLLNRGLAWLDSTMLVAKGKTDTGKEFTFEADLDGYASFDEDNLYDTIDLEFRSDDDSEVITLPTAALFKLKGESDDTDVEFILTQKWFETMPENFAGTAAAAAYNYRECEPRDGDEEVTFEKITDNLKVKFAKFQGLEDFYKERFITAAEEGVEAGLYYLETKPAKVVITLAISPRSHSVMRDGSSCELVPPFVPFYEFEGSHGTVACDDQGNRDAGTAYPEFHSFDVASMKQFGLVKGAHDIQEACGWHDSTKRIYLTPALTHMLWAIGLLKEPTHSIGDPEVRAAMVAAITSGLISPALYSAFWYEHTGFIKTIVGDAMEDLPPITRVWIYTNQN